MKDKMGDQINLGEWYEQEGLHYRFNGLDRGTNAVVRGDLPRLTQFVHQLDLTYTRSGLYTVEEIKEVLQRVLTTGIAQRTESFVFMDDRVREIRRMDDEAAEGPLAGSEDHLEIRHNEQWGGDYPANPKLSSRAMMIGHVLKALSVLQK